MFIFIFIFSFLLFGSMSRALPPPPLQLRKERLVAVEPAESGGGASPWRRRRKSVVLAAFVFVVVVVAAFGIVGVGFDNRRAPASSLQPDGSDLPPSLRNRLVELNARVASALKGALESAQERLAKRTVSPLFSKGNATAENFPCLLRTSFPVCCARALPLVILSPRFFTDHSHSSQRGSLSSTPKSH